MFCTADNPSAVLRVLLVVDHATLAEALHTHLDESDHIDGVTTMSSHEDLLATVNSTQPAVVLVDDQANADVGALCRVLSAQHPLIDLIVLGTASTHAARQQALDAGATAYVAKSLRGMSIDEKIRSIFDESQQHSRTFGPEPVLLTQQ